jgi:hypothetical protein
LQAGNTQALLDRKVRDVVLPYRDAREVQLEGLDGVRVSLDRQEFPEAGH